MGIGSKIMENKISENVLALAKRDLFADSVRQGIDYKDYKVYIPVYKKFCISGLPYVILEKKGELRISTPDESEDYLRVEAEYRRNRDKQKKLENKYNN